MTCPDMSSSAIPNFLLQDFLEAVQKCNKSVSKEDLDKYEKWMEEFGSS